MKVSIIGSGNVAWHFASRLSAKDADIEIIHRSPLSNMFNGINCSTSLELDSKTNLVILAVSDRAVKEVATAYEFPSKSIVVHSSGSVGIDVFDDNGISSYGVIYPLQSLTAGIEVKEMPIFVEGNSEGTQKTLLNVSKLISSNVQVVNSSDRRRIHTAAVFSSNFVNHLLSVSDEILRDVPLTILRPLILNTIDKALDIGPKKAQTGPALRRDSETISAHQAILETEMHKELYSMISKHIQNTFHA